MGGGGFLTDIMISFFPCSLLPVHCGELCELTPLCTQIHSIDYIHSLNSVRFSLNTPVPSVLTQNVNKQNYRPFIIHTRLLNSSFFSPVLSTLHCTQSHSNKFINVHKYSLLSAGIWVSLLREILKLRLRIWSLWSEWLLISLYMYMYTNNTWNVNT